MAGRCYALSYTSSRGTTHFRVDQEVGCRAPEDATKYSKAVADFLCRPGEQVKMIRSQHAVDGEWGDLPAHGAASRDDDGED
jgi:hypothetical protein